ncbi:MAG TPA: hypothetical protein VGG19_05025 [Tepidisphaeraceae bacterium]|jgi:hypothetical protein
MKSKLFGGVISSAALCVAGMVLVGATNTSAKADVLSTMIGNVANPDVDVLMYTYDPTSSPVATGIAGSMTLITPLIGPGVTNPLTSYMGDFTADLSGASTPALFQDITLDGGTTFTTMFDSDTLISSGAVTTNPGIYYYFEYREKDNTPYAKAGDIVGGLLTYTADPALGGSPIDVKEFVMVPTPAAWEAGTGLLAALAASSFYRRSRKQPAMG